MKHRVKHPHVEAVCEILRALGVSFRCQIQRHVVIWVQFGRRALRIMMPATPHDPDRSACQACRQIERHLSDLGFAGAV